MKLLSYGPVGHERAGILLGEAILDVEKASREVFQDPLPRDLGTLLGLRDWFERLQQLVSLRASLPEEVFVEFRGRRLGPPIAQPSKIIALGVNYREHLEETGVRAGVPNKPIIFAKAPSSVNGPYDDILYPPETRALDYEVELALVIGRKGKRIRPEAAYEYVAGYMVFNDISARDLQMEEMGGLGAQWFRGKSLDTFAPMGPWIVTRDELPEPHNLTICLKLNGEVRQCSNTGRLIFKIPEIIAFVSAGMTLLPGDIISTGTPAGVGMASEPPRFLRPGDVVHAEIEGIGYLENKIVKEVG